MGVGKLNEQEEATLWNGRKYLIGDRGYMKLELHKVTSIPVLSISGKIMGNTAAMAIEKIDAYLEKVPGYLIIDMDGCEYMSSTTLGFLARLAFDRHESGHDVFLVSVGEKVSWMLSIMDMDDFFQVRDSVEEAATEALVRGKC